MALEAHADVLLVSPVFQSPGHGPPSGVTLLRGVRKASVHREFAGALYALGGVTEENAAACIEAGADGVAVIRSVLEADDPADALRRIVEVVRRARATEG
jgi:thiamine-phosphate pyrophosphorylase